MRRTRPTFEALEAFLIVADTSLIKTAGERLGMTASAVSQTLKRLEEQLGAALFERDVRPLKLTAEGRRLREAARPIVAAALALPEAIAAGALENMTLRLGLSETISATIAPWLIGSLMRRVGRLETRSGFTRPLVEALRENALDVILTPEPLVEEERWARERLYEEDFLLVLPRGAAWPETTAELRREVARRPLIDYAAGSSDEVEINRIVRSMELPVEKRVSVSSSHALVGLVVEADGWSIVPATNLWCGRRFIEEVGFGALPDGRRVLRTMWALADGRAARKALELSAAAARGVFRTRMRTELERADPKLTQYVDVPPGREP